MYWIFLVTASVTIALLVVAFVGAFARSLSLIRSTAARRVIVISIVLVAMIGLPGIIFLYYYSPSGLFEQTLKRRWESTRWFSFLCAAQLVVAALALLGAMTFGLWPVKAGPYQPRGSLWNLGKLFKRLGIAVFALTLTAILYDIELRWRLSRMRAHAIDIAASMAPPVPQGRNAATHYQRIIELVEADDRAYDYFLAQRIAVKLNNGVTSDPDLDRDFSENSPTIAEFRLATACNDCRFDDSWNQIPYARFGVRGHVSRAARYAARLAKYRASQGKHAESIELIVKLRRFVDHLQTDPRDVLCVDFLQGERLAQQAIAHLLTYGPVLPAKTLRALMAPPLDLDAIHRNSLRWAGAYLEMALADAYLGRLLQTESSLDWAPAGEPNGIPTSSFGLMIERILYARDDLSAVFSHFPFLDHPENPEVWEDARLALEGHFAERLELTGAARGWGEEAAAYRLLSNIALAAELYRQDHGEWPHEEHALVPDYLDHAFIDPNVPPRLFARVANGLVVFIPRESGGVGPIRDDVDWLLEISHDYVPALFLGDALRALNAKEATALDSE